uniref:AarF domain containing kinase 2 n=1 Tax=Anolis carolinensis TaxID=28377 RepID=G1KKX0_ANOCA|nr:PREDICTED: uncharacterized aarF domain-containing protein kinase 2 [Anolis carolinensis]|eukprot:XP_003220915.2 PREDICTED: uncharacterized aarF domain-containing protein kinase 2 [Anolis carolinensis]
MPHNFLGLNYLLHFYPAFLCPRGDSRWPPCVETLHVSSRVHILKCFFHSIFRWHLLYPDTMASCYSCTARVFLSKVRWLPLRKSLCYLRNWGRRSVGASSSIEIRRRFRGKGLIQITLLCWGIGGSFQGAKCDSISGLHPQRTLHILPDNTAFVRRVGLVFSLVIRACILLLKFGPFLWLYPFTYISPSFASLWIHLLLKATESSGPTFIKLGQWASTRRDLFSEEFCLKFSKLHIKVVPHSWDYTKRSLTREFGEVWEKVFTFESQEPVGSGCVAQVYKAYVDISAFGEPATKDLSKSSALESWQVLGFKGFFEWLWKRKHEDIPEGYGDRWLHHKDGIPGSVNWSSVSGYPNAPSSPKRDRLLPVAIKVLHPGLVRQVQMDLFLMKMSSRFVELLPGVKWLSLTEIVEEFEKLMIQQIDLRYEARNLERFHFNFRDVDYVKFPKPLHPFVTRNILVETFEESKPISHYLHTEATMEFRRKLAKMGMDMLLKMVFVDNFVHADLHPGNVLVQGAELFSDHLEDQTVIVDLLDTLILEVQPSPSPLRLVLLDAGIVAELQVADLENFRAVFTAVVLGQGERVAELILHHARANQCKNVEKFKADMAQLVKEARSNTIALGKLQVASLLSSVFKLLMTHQVKLESNFASVVFAIMVLEGLGRSLDPELDILKAAKPLLIKPSSSLL